MNTIKFWCLLAFTFQYQGFAVEFTNLNLDTHVNNQGSETYKLPGWNIYNSISQYYGYILDMRPEESEGAILNDTFYSNSNKDGNYGLCLRPQYLTGPPYGRAEMTLSQMGTVPSGTQSLYFKWYWGSFDVLVNGQPLTQYWNNYSYGAILWTRDGSTISSGVDAWVDVHEYAGDEVTLSFNTLMTWDFPISYNILDDIQFSDKTISDIMGPDTLIIPPYYSVPEPSTIALGLLGAVVLWAFGRKKIKDQGEDW